MGTTRISSFQGPSLAMIARKTFDSQSSICSPELIIVEKFQSGPASSWYVV